MVTSAREEPKAKGFIHLRTFLGTFEEKAHGSHWANRILADSRLQD